MIIPIRNAKNRPKSEPINAIYAAELGSYMLNTNRRQ